MPHEPERTCPICGAESHYIFTSKHDRRIFECPNRECGHYFTPAPSETDGLGGREADLERRSAESLAAWDERNARLLALLMREARGPSRRLAFLDFGAGDAHVSRTFKRLLGERCAIYCLDASPACGGFHRRHGLVEVASLDAIPEKIDVVYMIEVIEHLTDPIASLRSLHGILSPGGFVFLSTPEGSSRPRETNAYDGRSHLHFFTPRSLGLALETAGFERIRFRHHPEMYALPPKGSARRLLHGVKAAARPWLMPILRPHVEHGHLVGVTRARADAPRRPAPAPPTRP
jgi:SAM-dependent methyltransferase